MGLFKSNNEYKSNNKLFEVLCTSTETLENKLEEAFLYRNIDFIKFTPGATLVKYKDLKVRSPLEVKQMREKLRKEAGLEFER